MLSPDERYEIQQVVHQELAAIEHDIAHNAGSYRYLCTAGGVTFFSHTPVGAVVRVLHRPSNAPGPVLTTTE